MAQHGSERLSPEASRQACGVTDFPLRSDTWLLLVLNRFSIYHIYVFKLYEQWQVKGISSTHQYGTRVNIFFVAKMEQLIFDIKTVHCWIQIGV